MSDELFGDGDPFNDPTWQKICAMAGSPPRPAEGYVTCNLEWLRRVLPVLRSADRLAVALLLYRQCLLCRSRTVNFSNNEAHQLGVGRNTKYRALAELAEAGALTIQIRNGRSMRVTLHWFP
jgi:hypothetical protein